MNEQTREQFLAETQAAKARAQAVLSELLEASAECDAHLSRSSRKDMVRTVTGRSALDAAVTTTRRIIENFDRAIHEVLAAAAADARRCEAWGAMRSPPVASA